MIRVRKPAAPPPRSALTTRGAEETKKLCDAHDAGQVKFEFDRTVYGPKSVKDALLEAQHHKCCFCETKLGHADHGDVEHFRPKGGWQQDETDALHQPGYYWLAYEWSNLYASCSICNTSHKGNFFPLADPATRNTHYDADIASEVPLLLDPAGPDNPEDHIGFRGEFVYPINDSARGDATIRICGLDREHLEEDRRRSLATVRSVLVILHHKDTTAEERDDALRLLDEALSDAGEYAAMARCYFRKWQERDPV